MSRELIIKDVVQTLEALSAIKKVERIQPEFNDLTNIPATVFPFAAVTGELPVPEYEDHYCESGTDITEEIVSSLPVIIFIYGYNNKNPDEEISDLLSSLWKALNTDRSRGGNAFYTRIEPEVRVGRFSPYFVFSINLEIRYQHTLETI